MSSMVIMSGGNDIVFFLYKFIKPSIEIANNKNNRQSMHKIEDKRIESGNNV